MLVRIYCIMSMKTSLSPASWDVQHIQQSSVLRTIYPALTYVVRFIPSNQRVDTTAFNMVWVHIRRKSASRYVSFVVFLSSAYVCICHWR
jgi:hypothetical protein